MSDKEVYRIGRYLSHLGLCSRRTAADFLSSHQVIHNGERITRPDYKLEPDAMVLVDGKSYRASAETEIILLNKPTGYVCSHKAQKGQRSIFTLLPPEYSSYYFAGRLDVDSRGLVVLSNKGDLIYKLTHPSNKTEKHYRVHLSRPLDNRELEKVTHGVYHRGDKLRASTIDPLPSKAHYLMVLTEGKNREIRRIFSTFGIDVIDLYRTSIGPYLIGDLEEGNYIAAPCSR